MDEQIREKINALLDKIELSMPNQAAHLLEIASNMIIAELEKNISPDSEYETNFAKALENSFKNFAIE